MKNRILNYPASTSKSHNFEATFEEWRDAAQTRIVDRVWLIEKYVQMHLVVGLGTAFGMGMVLGWVIKRK